MKFLVDFDSTLADTFRYQLVRMNEKFGTSYVEEDFTEWDTSKTLTQEMSDYLWSDQCFLSDSFQLSVPPVRGAVSALHTLYKLGHTCMIVSDRPQRLYPTTCAWMENHGLGGIPVMCTRNKHTISDQTTDVQTKSQIAYLYKLTHVIEDSPHNARLLGDREYITKVYLIDKANNRHIVSPKIQRVTRWSQIMEDVQACV